MMITRFLPDVRLLPGLVGGGVLSGAAFALGILASNGAEASRAEWLGFAGALLGAAITILGSVSVLEWQRGREDRELRALLLELLDDVDEACVPFQLANQSALEAKHHRKAAEQVRMVQAAIARVHKLRERWVPDTARMMKVSDSLADLRFDGPDLPNMLKAIAFYPASADFGGLNAMGHEIQGTTSKARDILLRRELR